MLRWMGKGQSTRGVVGSGKRRMRPFWFDVAEKSATTFGYDTETGRRQIALVQDGKQVTEVNRVIAFKSR